MDASRALTDDILDVLRELAGYEFDLRAQRGLEDSLAGLVRSAREAAPSYLGMTITVVVSDQPITLTVLERPLAIAAQATSMSLSLSWVPTVDPASTITFYAATAGAFVDLAADLSFALGEIDLHLDGDLAHPPVPGLAGLPALAAVNRALGILIGHGHTPEGAQRELRRRANSTRNGLQQAALDLAADPTSSSLDG